MKTVIYSKRVTNAELGKTGMHETYFRINKDFDIQSLISSPEIDKEIELIDKRTGLYLKNIRYKYTKTNQEQRIVGLGPYYQEKKLCAGDEIVLERHIDRGGNDKYYINYRKFKNIIVFTKLKTGYSILSPENVGKQNLTYLDGKIKVICMGEEYQRSNSPAPTVYYDIFIKEKNVSNSCTENKVMWIINLDDPELRPRAVKARLQILESEK